MSTAASFFLKGLRQWERIPLQFYKMKQLFTHFVQQSPQGENKIKMKKEKDRVYEHIYNQQSGFRWY
jgi:hypothetical protein